MTGGYAARQGIWPWAGIRHRFKARNYHYVLATGILGAFLLFLSSIITDNAIYAIGAIPYLISFTIAAATAKTHQLTKQTKPNSVNTPKTQENPNQKQT